MTQPDANRAFKQLKEEHRLALKTGDLEALQKIQAKLDELSLRRRRAPAAGVGEQ